MLDLREKAAVYKMGVAQFFRRFRPSLPFLLRFFVGGLLVAYSMHELRDVLYHKPNFAREHLHLATPACPSGTTTYTNLSLTEDGTLKIVFTLSATEDDAFICQKLIFMLANAEETSPVKISIGEGWVGWGGDPSKRMVEAQHRKVDCPDNTPPPSPGAEGAFEPWQCTEYSILSQNIHQISIGVDLPGSVDERTYTKSALSFRIDYAISPIRFELPGIFDVSSTNANAYQNHPLVNTQYISFVSPYNDETTFFLENLQRAEEKDAFILIFGALLGTGVALLAEATASLFRGLAGGVPD